MSAVRDSNRLPAKELLHHCDPMETRKRAAIVLPVAPAILVKLATRAAKLSRWRVLPWAHSVN